MVPTRVSCGRSGSLGLGTAATFGIAAGATAGGGGRRDGEKIGRSRVMGNCESGIAHNGLALNARSDAAATGFALIENALGPVCAPPARSASSASLEIADVDADAPP